MHHLRLTIIFILLAGCFFTFIHSEIEDYKVKEGGQRPGFIKSEDMVKVLQDAHDGKGNIVKKKFVESFKAHGGSGDNAAKAFILMNKNQDAEMVSLKTLEENLANIVALHTDHFATHSEGPEQPELDLEPEQEPEVVERRDPRDDLKDIELDIEEQSDEVRQRTEQLKKMIEDEFNQKDHMKPFEEDTNNNDDDEDEYPAHEPIYQPSEEGYMDEEITVDDMKNKKTKNEDEPILSYDDDLEEINKYNERLMELEKNQDLNGDGYVDHEPIYQPSDAESIGNRDGSEKSEQKNTEKVDEKNVYEEVVVEEDIDSEEGDFLDENEDGYPDHEPIYQPEDENMMKTIPKSDDAKETVSDEDRQKPPRQEL